MPFTIEGDTLGQQHRNFNKLVNEAIKDNATQPISAINYEETDLENLFKIDLACNNKNVEYILETFKCGDMLYVSRAIKQSTWLITEKKYSYIINPNFLNNNLHPQMTLKGFNKLILQIRLNLKDEQRVEQFFNYYKQDDLKTAFKWLPQCSIPFIEKIILNHANDIPKKLLKRLYVKSFSFLEIISQNSNATYNISSVIQPGMFLLNKNLDKTLDIIETIDISEIITFGPKHTRHVMKKNPERIMNNIEKYVTFLDIATFAKCLKPEVVEEFILTYIKNANMRTWFTFDNIKYFLKRLPDEEMFNFVNKLFIEKSYRDTNVDTDTWITIVEQCDPLVKSRGAKKVSSSKTKYRWYYYAPFETSFDCLKKLIRFKKIPTYRIRIMQEMVTSAGNDPTHILTLLKYYRDNHINEPLRFKIEFVNDLISKTDTHKYSNEAWEYLNDIFKSLDVYATSSDNVQSCVQCILLHNVIHGEDISEIIVNKFDLEDYISNNEQHNKYNNEEREKVVKYLYKYWISNITSDITNENEYCETKLIVVKILKLLNKFNKELKDYPLILQKIKNLIVIAKERSWGLDLSIIYNINKSWRKLLFTESLIISPTQNSWMNALKHNPKLIEIYKKEMDSYIKANGPFDRFLKKIRVYNKSLTDAFKTSFTEELKQINSHKSTIKSLCILFTQKELLKFVHQYVPNENKIAWDQTDELTVSIRHTVAKCMHLARPHPPLEMVLLYAKGDYLQHILPSLNSVFYNASSVYLCDYLAQLLDAPVSLQKHGIRLAFSKLNYEELKTIVYKIWKLNKNNSIRKEIFCLTFETLCRESDETIVLEVWKSLRIFIDELTFSENIKIYSYLCQVEKVPFAVRLAFMMKSYNFFTKMPHNVIRAKSIDNLNTKINYSDREVLDANVKRIILFTNFDNDFTKQSFRHSCLMARFMLSTKDECVQNERYEKMLIPLIDKAVTLWNVQYENIYFARNNLSDIFASMSTEFNDLVWKQNMVFPIAMYAKVLNKLQNSLSTRENYIFLTNVKLSLGFIRILNDSKLKFADSEEMKDLDIDDKLLKLLDYSAPIFGKLCVDCLKEDVTAHFSSIYVHFAHVLNHILQRYKCNIGYNYKILKVFLENKNFIEGYLLVTEMIGRVKKSKNCDNIDDENPKLELMKELSSHSSDVVAVHYWNLLRKLL